MWEKVKGLEVKPTLELQVNMCLPRNILRLYYVIIMLKNMYEDHIFKFIKS